LISISLAPADIIAADRRGGFGGELVDDSAAAKTPLDPVPELIAGSPSFAEVDFAIK
jgi:hypothetical protein